MQLVQPANRHFHPVPGSIANNRFTFRASQPQPRDIFSTRAKMPNPVRFGKLDNITGPIPPNSFVVLVPGIFSTAENMRALAKHYKDNGHRVHTLESPFNKMADSALASTDWLTHRVDNLRLDEASRRCSQLINELDQIPAEGRVKVLQHELNLKDTPLGRATAKATLGLMYTSKSDYRDETDLTQIIMEMRRTRERMGGDVSPEAARKELHSLTTIARKRLRRELMTVFRNDLKNVSAEHDAMEKTIDHVMDQIAPRVVLVGHSMGGFVSMLTLFEQMNDTCMVVGLNAPGENGTSPIPEALRSLKKLSKNMQVMGRSVAERMFPGLRHMLEGSPETKKLKADHQPFNTTIFALGMPRDYDGVVGERNFKMNDQLPGRINVVVTPRQASIIEVASETLNDWHKFIGDWNPLYTWLARSIAKSSEFVKSIAYHCGLLQFQKQYWNQDGDILRGVFEAPKDKSGDYNYQFGTPDYGEAVKQIRRVLAPANYEAERTHFLTLLEDKLMDAKRDKPQEFQVLLKAYAPLKADLQAFSQERQPIKDGVADKAAKILKLLNQNQDDNSLSTTNTIA